MLKKLPLRTVFVVPFVIKIFVAVSLTGYLSFKNGEKAVDELTTQIRREITARIHQHLEAYMAPPQLINQINDDLIQQEMLPEDLENLFRYFWRQGQAFPTVGTIAFASQATGNYTGANALQSYVVFAGHQRTEGAIERYTIDEQGNIGELLFRREDYDPRKRDWYQMAVEQGKPTWSEVEISTSGERLDVTAVYPVYDQNQQLIGVLQCDYILTEIGHFLQTVQVGKTGQTFILERNGDLIASSSLDQPFILIPDQEAQRIHASDSEDPLIRGTAQYLEQEFNSLAEIDQTYQREFRLNNAPQLLQVTPFEDAWGLNWLVVVVVPESDFMAQIDANTRTTIALCLIALAVATGGGILTARWVVQPILQLNRVAKELAEGKWEQTVKLDRQDEVGELADSFNQMARQLQESFTTLEAQNQELQKLDQLKDEFLANTSHELRTPLNGMIGIAESMIAGATGNLSTVQKQNLLMIAQSGHRLSNLVNDILDFAKLRHKNIELQLKPVTVASIVEIVVLLNTPLIQQKSLRVINDIPENLPDAEADENRLEQILHNLVGNAIKFTESGEIKISAEVWPGDQNQKQPVILITVMDTGIGIPEDKLERIFMSFEQAAGSTAREYGGTGLGLAVTKQLLELHGGKIWAESQVGVGSKFRFTLPMSQQEKTTLASPSSLWKTTRLPSKLHPVSELQSVAQMTKNGLSSESNSGLKILIVDDEPINLQVLANHLSSQSYAITQANNGLEALQLIEAGFKPDLVVLDVMIQRLKI